jgi:hypothetical protein
MNICSECGNVMHCSKTGRDVNFQPSNLTYSGDEFECLFCENKVVICGVGSAPRDASKEILQEGRIIVGDLLPKEKVLEEGELGEVIGIFILKQGKPTEDEIRKAIEESYGDPSEMGFDMMCEEYKPGVWKVASYTARHDE